MPLLHDIVSVRSNLSLIHIEADESTVEIMKHFNVDRVPTVLLLDDGKEFARATGFQPREIFELWIDAKIDEYLKSKS